MLIHFFVRPFAAVHLNDTGFVAVGLGICAGSAKCLGPIGGEPLGMVLLESVAEGMTHHFIGHDATVPSLGKAAQTNNSASGFEHATHT